MSKEEELLLEIEKLKEKLFDADETNGKLNWYRTAYFDLVKVTNDKNDKNGK